MALNLSKRWRLWRENSTDKKNLYKTVMSNYPAIEMTRDNYDQVAGQVKSLIDSGKGNESWGVIMQALQQKHQQFSTDPKYTGYFADKLKNLK